MAALEHFMAVSAPQGNSSEALQFSGLWENTPPSPQVSCGSGLLVVQLWVRVGWPKTPCEGQTKPKLRKGGPTSAHITYLFHCSTHTCWKLCPPWLEHHQPWLWSFAGAGHPIPELQKPMRELGAPVPWDM